MAHLYTGAYTEPPLGRSEGIGIYRYDDANGTVELLDTVTGLTNPTFLTASADERFIYAICESDGAAVAAFRRDPASGALTKINQQAAGGNGACHISIDPSGEYALVANYGSGSVAALPINTDGSLGEATSVVQHEGSGPNTARQDGPHAHMFIPTPDGRFAVSADLGADEVITYSLDTSTGKLERQSAVEMEPGAGPRHIAFAPSGTIAYIINELGNTITTCDYDPETGALSVRDSISTLPVGYGEETYTAHVIATEDGRFVYGSNRGHDSIVTCEVDASSGKLNVVDFTSTEGSFPRNFAFDPTGKRMLVANQNGDNMAVLARDAETGRLTRERVIDGIPSTVCLHFCAEGNS